MGRSEIPIATNQFSYALLRIERPGGRQNEWAATLNSAVAVVFDRNTAEGPNPVSAPGNAARSIHGARRWQGSVGYNDGHVVFEPSNLLAEPTIYGNVVNPAGSDDLFFDKTTRLRNNAQGVFN